jgi:hypothetical protein
MLSRNGRQAQFDRLGWVGGQHLVEPNQLGWRLHVGRVAQQQLVSLFNHPTCGLVVAELVGRIDTLPADHLPPAQAELEGIIAPASKHARVASKKR